MPRFARARRAASVLAVLLVLPLAATATAEPPPLTQGAYRTGYVPMSDGALLRYTVFLPSETGRFPTLLQYDGYAAGTNPFENGQARFGARMLAKGYAVLGVNVRGSGCSSGTFDMFEPRWAQDGHDVVEWAARQPWSTGDVGMFGVSMPAIMSMFVAATRPPHLRAIAPAAALGDIYRDVAYPGGLFNRSFATLWTGEQKLGYQDAPLVVAADGGDPACAGHVAAHTTPDRVVVTQAASHAYDDAFWSTRAPAATAARIGVPVLSFTSWQDEQVSSRVALVWSRLDPTTSWAVLSNGNHGLGVAAPRAQALQEAFFDRFVAGASNGFEATPRVQVWHELDSRTYEPRWVSAYAEWPAARATAFALAADGSLKRGAAHSVGQRSWLHPAPSPLVPTLGSDLPPEGVPWSAPDTGVGWTSAPLDEPLELFGTASADLWVSTTASDTDVQVTLSEVRADGAEMFVQRGWLRASHRALDPARSTAALPHHPHDAASTAEMPPGVPQLLRIELTPFGHVFRAGSRLRLTVDSPAGMTGYRVFDIVPAPAVNTVHVGGTTVSRLVVQVLPVRGPLPAYAECGTVVNQPCRWR